MRKKTMRNKRRKENCDPTNHAPDRTKSKDRKTEKKKLESLTKFFGCAELKNSEP